LQILSTRPLGNGSPEVCDNTLPDFGGVPAVPGENFAETEFITAAINDFACRFVDGQGNPRGRTADAACFRRPDGDFGFVNTNSQIQFCATIPRLMAFPPGDTLLTVRVRNLNGRTSLPARLIVRSRS